ncbi:MAG: hypothetical protein OJF49_002264 [Ktedonobacterales bacterium]|jgi:hypothetical protein|nr:MAG: hypothetical protein OJF49_002264 [Ktedonobacterales bacterium]
MTKPTPPCAHTDDLVEQGALGLLSTEDTRRLDERIAACPACRQRLDDYRALIPLMSTIDLHPIPSRLAAAVPPPLMAGSAPPPADDTPAQPTPLAPMPARRPTPRRLDGWYVTAAALLLVGLSALLFNSFAHLSRHTTSTTRTATETASAQPTPTRLPPNKLVLPKGTMLERIALVSPIEGWAIGNTINPVGKGSGVYGAVFVHYYNGQWHMVGQVHPGIRLDSISMDSPTDGWASGHKNFYGVFFHYTGGQWIEVDMPAYGEIHKVQMLSADDGWAVTQPAPAPNSTCPASAQYCSGGGVGGGQVNPGPSYILHYQNGVWSEIVFPTSFPQEFWLYWHPFLADLAMVSPDEGWAVGSGYILHYQSGQWSIAGRSVHLTDIVFVNMLSPADGWISGVSRNSPHVYALHYDGSSWTPTELPPNAQAYEGFGDMYMRIETTLSGGAWAFEGAFFGGAASPPTRSFVLAYQNGVWQRVSFPSNLYITDVAQATPDEAWAIAWIIGPYPADTVILHLQNGVWSIYGS